MAFVEQGTRSRLSTIAAVALVHVGIGYAFISGLAFTVIEQAIPVFRVNSIPDAPPPPPLDPAPAPKTAMPDTVTAPPTVVTLAPVPDVAIEQAPVVTPLPLPTLPAIPEAQPVARPAPSGLASDARARGNKTEWITTDDYPPAALRAEAEGTVAISVGIDAHGRVSDCRVTQSSGHPVLDDATCRLYARRARFAPALDDAGAPMATHLSDRIRWQMPR